MPGVLTPEVLLNAPKRSRQQTSQSPLAGEDTKIHSTRLGGGGASRLDPTSSVSGSGLSPRVKPYVDHEVNLSSALLFANTNHPQLAPLSALVELCFPG